MNDWGISIWFMSGMRRPSILHAHGFAEKRHQWPAAAMRLAASFTKPGFASSASVKGATPTTSLRFMAQPVGRQLAKGGEGGLAENG
jgi:hypothetical protein